jgi:hypothetical protein
MRSEPYLARKSGSTTTMAKKKSEERGERYSSGHKHKLIGVRLEASLRQQVETLAVAETRSLAQMCVVLIKEALVAREKK